MGKPKTGQTARYPATITQGSDTVAVYALLGGYRRQIVPILKGSSKMTLFEQFQGADLERLTECLTAIRKAGLSVDKHTIAGVNENSGNVWVFSEYWVGCVACSIGFDVFWVYNCRDCGEEHEFATHAEMGAYYEEYWNDCHTCRTEEVEA